MIRYYLLMFTVVMTLPQPFFVLMQLFGLILAGVLVTCVASGIKRVNNDFYVLLRLLQSVFVAA